MKKSWITACGITIFAAGLAYLQYSSRDFDPKIDEDINIEIEAPEILQANFLFGINVDGFDIIEGTVGKNQTLSTILQPFNVPYQIIDQIAKKSKEVFDVRKIAFNKKYTVFANRDSAQAQYLIYEPNPAEYVVFKLDDGEIYKEEKPVEIRKREIAGTIDRSLYVNMVELGITPDLIDQFADIYGWTVDFQRLQKGDKFKVVFNERWVEDHIVGVEEIQSAYFEHMGEGSYAIPFEQNGEMAFFDQNGNSHKKAFLRDPLKYSRISSRYNLNRFHPVQKRYKAHLGTDYAAPTGTEIRSVGDGYVEAAGYTSGNGNYVKIKHNGTYSTQYLHMSKIGNGVKKGARIKQGQVIGYVGSTGLATGPHLCFRFWKNGKQVDWLKEKIPPSDPILQENKLAFEQVLNDKIQLLAGIRYVDEEPDTYLSSVK